jgi:hypothetical protein
MRDGPYRRASPARICPADSVTKAPRPVSVTAARCPAGSGAVARTRRCATPSRRVVPERLAGGLLYERRQVAGRGARQGLHDPSRRGGTAGGNGPSRLAFIVIVFDPGKMLQIVMSRTLPG